MVCGQELAAQTGLGAWKMFAQTCKCAVSACVKSMPLLKELLGSTWTVLSYHPPTPGSAASGTGLAEL